MTSNERKILECIQNHGGEAHIHLISNKMGVSSDYCYLLCRALESAGHLKFSGHNFCQLSEKGREYFQDHNNAGIIAASSVLQETSTNDPALSSILSDGEDDQSKKDKSIDKKLKEFWGV